MQEQHKSDLISVNESWGLRFSASVKQKYIVLWYVFNLESFYFMHGDSSQQ